MVVPNIIHQVWIYKDSEKNLDWAKKKFKESIISWKRHHPKFEYKLWSNKEIYNLITDNFPEILPKIKKIYNNDIIILADIARLCILYIYGGIYSDLDIIAHQKYDEILNTENLLVPSTKPFGFSNDLLITPKNNNLIRLLIDNFSVKNYIPIRGLRVLYSCGPMYLTEQLIKNRFSNSYSFSLIPDEYYKGHIEGSTWLTKEDNQIKELLLEQYNSFSNQDITNNLDKNLIPKLSKRDFIYFYEKIDCILIPIIFIYPRLLKSYYMFRLLDIIKSSSNKPISRINTTIHSFYRLLMLNVINKKHNSYLWMKYLSLISLTEMKTVKLPGIFIKIINAYVLLKHLNILRNALINNEKVSKYISTKKLLSIHLIESIFHFYILTPRNFLLN